MINLLYYTCSNQWILDKQVLDRQKDTHKDLQTLSEEEYHKIGIFFAGGKCTNVDAVRGMTRKGKRELEPPSEV